MFKVSLSPGTRRLHRDTHSRSGYGYDFPSRRESRGADEELNPVREPPTPSAIRDELQRLVIADLHGPLGGEYEE
jgi:hypothetical protein